MERNEEARDHFKATLATLDPNKIRYLDEAGIDNHEVYSYGWNLRGDRLESTKKAKKSQRISMISSLFNKSLSASFIFEGPCNRHVFEFYVEKILVPSLTRGEIVVMDNASFHHGGRIKKLIEDAGCTLLYLPSYSPDLNPIEHSWFPLKNKIRRFLTNPTADFYTAVCNAFEFN